MQAESNIRPAETAVEKLPGDAAEIVLRENITETQRDEATAYTYDEYRLVTAYRDNLLASVEANRAAWLVMAIAADTEGTTPTVEERLAATEAALLDIILGGD